MQYQLINLALAKVFGKDQVTIQKAEPGKGYEFELVFQDDNASEETIKLAQAIVNKYNPSKFFDDQKFLRFQKSGMISKRKKQYSKGEVIMKKHTWSIKFENHKMMWKCVRCGKLDWDQIPDNSLSCKGSVVLEECQYFIGCHEPATKVVPHPAFPNGVPCCERCFRFATEQQSSASS